MYAKLNDLSEIDLIENERNRSILRMIRDTNLTHHEIGKCHGISSSKICQIATQYLSKELLHMYRSSKKRGFRSLPPHSQQYRDTAPAIVIDPPNPRTTTCSE